MSIVWREAMAVGDKVVDDEHKHLIDLINGFEGAIQGDIDHRQIKKVLLGLVEYSAEHFRHEESLQIEIEYPFFFTHKRAHRDLLNKLVEVVTHYTSAPEAERDGLVREIAEFLRSWLVNHIIESDLKMRPFLSRVRHF